MINDDNENNISWKKALKIVWQWKKVSSRSLDSSEYLFNFWNLKTLYIRQNCKQIFIFYWFTFQIKWIVVIKTELIMLLYSSNEPTKLTSIRFLFYFFNFKKYVQVLEAIILGTNTIDFIDVVKPLSNRVC